MLLFLLFFLCFGLGSFNGANAYASATFDAIVFCDYSLAVLFADSVNGAFVYTSHAAETFVRNDVSHYKYLQKLI
jgi:hypothetical protein